MITRNGKPTARLVPVERKDRLAGVFGAFRGQIWMPDDFDELPDDLADAFGMR